MADILGHSTLSTGLVSYWSLGEASGTRADSHGSNDLADNFTVTSTTGIGGSGTAALFASANTEFLSITDAAQSGLDLTGSFSLNIWYNPTTNVSTANVIGKWNGAAGQGSYRGAVQLTGKRHGTLLSTSGSYQAGNDKYQTMTTLSAGTWYMLTWVYDNSAGTMVHYLDGSSLGTSTGLTTSALFNGTSDFRIGASGNGAEYMNAAAQFAGVWSKVLTGTEVTDLYNSGAGLPYYDPNIAASLATLQITPLSATISVQSDTDVSAAVAALQITPSAASVSLDVDISAGTAPLQITPSAAAVSFDANISGGLASLQITGQPAAIAVDVNVAAATAILQLTGQPATVSLDVGISASAAALQIAPHSATVSTQADTTIDAQPAALQITGLAATVSADVTVSAAAASLAVTTNAATISADGTVSASVVALQLTPAAASVSLDRNIQAAVVPLQVTPRAASVAHDVVIVAGLATLQFAGVTATISLGAAINHIVIASFARPRGRIPGGRAGGQVPGGRPRGRVIGGSQ